MDFNQCIWVSKEVVVNGDVLTMRVLLLAVLAGNHQCVLMLLHEGWYVVEKIKHLICHINISRIILTVIHY